MRQSIITAMMEKPLTKRAALYLRVSTDSQTTENQRRALEEIAERHGWIIAAEHVFEDAGVSGAKSRDQRPAFDALLKAVARREIEVVMSWSVDRLGRSLPDLIGFLSDIQVKCVDLYLHQQAIDTSTPTGKMLFQMLSVFAEFERSILRSRVMAGLSRARINGVKLGRRPAVVPVEVKQIQRSLDKGLSIRAIAKKHSTSPATVMRVKQQTHVSMTGSHAP